MRKGIFFLHIFAAAFFIFLSGATWTRVVPPDCFFAHSLLAVSYTHLDVYKRQHKGKRTLLPVVYIQPPKAIPAVVELIEGRICGINTVSYTHLDVYKRQVHISEKQRMI